MYKEGSLWRVNVNQHGLLSNCDANNNIFNGPTAPTITSYAQIAAAEAVYVTQTLKTNLAGFELGNEPGRMGAMVSAGVDQSRRPPPQISAQEHNQ